MAFKLLLYLFPFSCSKLRQGTLTLRFRWSLWTKALVVPSTGVHLREPLLFFQQGLTACPALPWPSLSSVASLSDSSGDFRAMCQRSAPGRRRRRRRRRRRCWAGSSSPPATAPAAARFLVHLRDFALNRTRRLRLQA